MSDLFDRRHFVMPCGGGIWEAMELGNGVGRADSAIGIKVRGYEVGDRAVVPSAAPEARVARGHHGEPKKRREKS